MSTLTWIIRHHLRQRWKLFYVVIMSIVQVFLVIYPISITAQVIDQVINDDFNDIGLVLLWLFGFSIFQALIYFSVNFVNEILAHRITTNITQELFESLQAKSLRFHNELDVGQIMARATGDTRVINNALSPGIVRSLTIFTAWIVTMYLSATVDLRLLGFTILMFLIYLGSVVQFTRSRIEISRKVLVGFSDLNELGLQSISSIKEVKSFRAEEHTTTTYQLRNLDYVSSLRKEGIMSAWFYPALVATFYVAAMISFAIYLAYLQEINFSQVVLIAGILVYLRSVSSEIQWQSRMIMGAIAGSQRVYRLIVEKDQEVLQDDDIKPIPEDNASIEFKHVSFRYADNLPWALNEISFEIADNQTIAIVGGPGSGKSTITKLIQRLYLPTKGEIRIGGIPIQNLQNSELRKYIATVEQDVFLFNTTVRENIRFGRPDATDTEVEEVAKIAHAHQFISEFPAEYDTIIGEGGVRLSGGQAQRLSIARALLVDPQVLVLDDGASALDARTELQIQEAIAEILQTRTTIVTTHRLSIIAKADPVLIISKGSLVGIGTHKELIKSNPHYRKLFEYHYELPELEVNL